VLLFASDSAGIWFNGTKSGRGFSSFQIKNKQTINQAILTACCRETLSFCMDMGFVKKEMRSFLTYLVSFTGHAKGICIARDTISSWRLFVSFRSSLASLAINLSIIAIEIWQKHAKNNLYFNLQHFQ